MIGNTISVCLIVKNEEKGLARCLNSVINFADEIIVVDTGSTDNTVEIAKQFNAKVFFHKWNNNFSDARNKSIENATKDWILFLDADEEIPYDDGLNIKKTLLQNSHIEGFHLRLVNIINGINAGDAIVLRIFKNKPEYRFSGRMHEQIVTCIEKLNPPGCLGCTDIRILHYGYDGELYNINEKQKRNLALLESYPEEDRDGYFYYSLANEYARVSENDKALEIYDIALNVPYDMSNVPIYVPYLFSNILKVLGNEHRYADVIKSVNKFKVNFENFKDLYFYESLAYTQCCKFSLSRESLIKYLNCPKGNYEYPDANFAQQFNIDEMIINLNQTCINRKPNLLSVVIMADENNPSISESIKSINEIADEVFVAISSETNINKKSIESVYGEIVEVDSTDKGEIFISAVSKCSGDYILLLKPDEFSSFAYHQGIVELLQNPNEDYFNIYIVDHLNGTSSTEFRLYKNSDELKSLKTFNEYEEFVSSKVSKTVPIYLNKNINKMDMKVTN